MYGFNTKEAENVKEYLETICQEISKGQISNSDASWQFWADRGNLMEKINL